MYTLTHIHTIISATAWWLPWHRGSRRTNNSRCGCCALSSPSRTNATSNCSVTDSNSNSSIICRHPKCNHWWSDISSISYHDWFLSSLWNKKHEDQNSYLSDFCHLGIGWCSFDPILAALLASTSYGQGKLYTFFYPADFFALHSLLLFFPFSASLILCHVDWGNSTICVCRQRKQIISVHHAALL